MIRNLKAIGLAVLAVCALGAFSAASASAAEFHSSTAHTLLKGEQIGTDVFTTNAGTVSCNEANYTGTESTQTSSTATMTFNYSECTAFGFFGATIDTNECHYTFHTNVPVPTITIVCPLEKAITVTAPGCTVTVGNQTLTGVSFATEGKSPKRDVKTTINSSGITYTQHGEGLCSSGTFTNGTYKGEATTKGLNTEGGQVDLWYA